MDRNTIIGLVLILGIFIGWGLWMTPSKEEIEKQRKINDSIALVKQLESDSLARVTAAQVAKQEPKAQQLLATGSTDSTVVDSLRKIATAQYGAFANAALDSNKVYTVENDVVRLEIAKLGGRPVKVILKDYKTYDSLPLILFDSASSVFGFEFFSGKRLVSTDQLYFQPYFDKAENIGKTEFSVTGKDSLTFVMRLYADDPDGKVLPNSYIEYKYTLKGDDYMIGYKVNFVGMTNAIESNTTFINLNWSYNLLTQEKSHENEKNESTVYFRNARDKDVDYLNERKDEQKNIGTSLKWISFKSRFFVSTLIADQSFDAADLHVYTLDEVKQPKRYLESMKASIPMAYKADGDNSFGMRLYFGPNKYRTLEKYDLRLERQIPLGWSFGPMWWFNVYLVITTFDLLEATGINYGIIILILTILLKLLLFPIAYWSYRATAKMRVLRPEVEELGAKFKPEDSLKKQQATMDLYRKAGVNPMAGCWPMLLQFPILIAMFRFFPSSIELRQQAFLWADDLSSYDSIINLGFNIPFYGNHVSLFTLLMTISTLIYTKINNDMMSTGSQQLPGMKTAMYIMPIMFLGIFNNYASGLSYYYLLANLFTFAQIFIIRKTINEDKIHAKLQENKKKPVKKSSFQKRLEDMAKQRGYKG
ncbi:MAG: membrane protein insertase YidC [Sphingobacteriia bacterium]|nr:membrane protein insertase YidC [Sphingobacteriia bacterium]